MIRAEDDGELAAVDALILEQLGHVRKAELDADHVRALSADLFKRLAAQAVCASWGMA